MLDIIIDVFGVLSLVFMVYIAVYVLVTYISQVLKEQRKIKCLCHHEYEPYSAFYHFDGIEYEFKCRKCGKEISIDTVTRDKFNWVKEDEDNEE